MGKGHTKTASKLVVVHLCVECRPVNSDVVLKQEVPLNQVAPHVV